MSLVAVRLGLAPEARKMTFIKSWEEFEKAAERLYLQEPSKVRYAMKYTHSNGQLVLKMTDNRVVRTFTVNWKGCRGF